MGDEVEVADTLVGNVMDQHRIGRVAQFAVPYHDAEPLDGAVFEPLADAGQYLVFRGADALGDQRERARMNNGSPSCSTDTRRRSASIASAFR